MIIEMGSNQFLVNSVKNSGEIQLTIIEGPKLN